MHIEEMVKELKNKLEGHKSEVETSKNFENILIKIEAIKTLDVAIFSLDLYLEKIEKCAMLKPDNSVSYEWVD